jgi:hypothetical protein
MERTSNLFRNFNIIPNFIIIFERPSNLDQQQNANKTANISPE